MYIKIQNNKKYGKISSFLGFMHDNKGGYYAMARKKLEKQTHQTTPYL